MYKKVNAKDTLKGNRSNRIRMGSLASHTKIDQKINGTNTICIARFLKG